MIFSFCNIAETTILPILCIDIFSLLFLLDISKNSISFSQVALEAVAENITGKFWKQ